MIRWNVYMDDELLKRTKKHAHQRETTASDIVRLALEQYLAHHECTMPMAINAHPKAE